VPSATPNADVLETDERAKEIFGRIDRPAATEPLQDIARPVADARADDLDARAVVEQQALANGKRSKASCVGLS
jgi:hypothetical protein